MVAFVEYGVITNIPLSCAVSTNDKVQLDEQDPITALTSYDAQLL